MTVNLKKLVKNFVKTILKISVKAKSINENKYCHIINFQDSYVNNKQNDLDKFKERNGPSNIYDDKQLKLLVNYEKNLKNDASSKTQFENWYLAMPVLSFNGSKYLGHCTQRKEHFKENRALRAGGDDNNATGYEGIEKAVDLPWAWGKNPTWFELRARILGFRVEIKERLSNTELLRDMVCHVADSKSQIRLVY